MGIMIGSIFSGSMHTYKDQGIRSKFIIIGLPLFPVASYYKVTSSLGMPIPLNGKSVWHGYSRTTLLALGILGLVLSREIGIAGAVLSWALLINGLYSWFSYTHLKKEEEDIRYYLSRAMDYNILPELLPIETQQVLYQELLKRSEPVIGAGADWETIIRNGGITAENKYILLSLAHYNHILTGDTKYISLQEKFYPLFTTSSYEQ